MDLLFAFVAAGLITVASGIAILAVFQDRLIYRPDRRHLDPAACGLPRQVRARIVPVAGGVEIVQWSAQAEPSRPTLLYFHGQAGHLERRKPHFERMTAAGFGVVMPAYRGFSGSGGQPGEAALVADGVEHLDRLMAEGVPREKLVVYGASLGAAVAVQVAASRSPAGLVLVAPFRSLAHLAGRVMPPILVGPLLHDSYDTERIIARVSCPILILAGEQDGVVPVRDARVLADIVGTRATLVTFPFGGHNDLYRESNGAWPVLTQFLERVTGT